jgi:hypothetical protein
MPELNGNGESKFRKYLYNEVTLIIAVIGVVWGVFNYINNPQKLIEAEFNKHEAVQENYQANLTKELQVIREGDLKDLKADIIENRNELTKLTNEVIKLQTIINERIPLRK